MKLQNDRKIAVHAAFQSTSISHTGSHGVKWNTTNSGNNEAQHVNKIVSVSPLAFLSLLCLISFPILCFGLSDMLMP